jgi:hypothetical protein
MSPSLFLHPHTSKGLHARGQYHRLKTIYSQIQIPYVLQLLAVLKAHLENFLFHLVNVN